MAKVIAILFSDLHLNLWSRFNEKHSRTKNAFKFLNLIQEACTKYQAYPIFGGDFFHKPEYIDTELLNYLAIYVKKRFKRPSQTIYGISGNHDMSKTNNLEYSSPSLWRAICRIWPGLFHDISFSSVTFFDKFVFHGIPYLDHNIGLNDYIQGMELEEGLKHILLLHTDYPGARDTDDVLVDSVENLNTNLLSKFDLTLIGHIHKPQRLGRKVYIIGAPFQQRRTDRNADLGYWKLYDNLSLEFVPVNVFPRFIDVDSPDKILDDGNYYTVVNQIKEEEIVKPTHISVGMSKNRMVSRYLKAIDDPDPDKKRILIDILNEVDKK